MRVFSLVLASLACFLPAQAQAATLDDVRAMLHAGDIGEIETTLSEMAASKDQATIDIYRQVTNQLFRTSHPVVLDTLEQWLIEEPRSAAALSANAWAAINAFRLASDPYSFEFQQPRQREYTERWIDRRTNAIEMAQKALRAGRRNVSAIDAWLFTQRFKRDKGDIARVATDLMNLSPDRASVLSITGAMVQGALNPGRAATEACWTYGNRAQDYDKDLCLIEAAFAYTVEQDLRVEAERRLAQTNDPRLDWARLDVAVFSDPLPSAEELMPLLLAYLDRRRDLDRYDSYAQRIAALTDDPTFLEAAREAHLERLDEWLRDDPHNPRFLHHKAGIHLANGEYDAARQSVLDALHHGWIDIRVWYTGAGIEFEQKRTINGARYIESGAAMAGVTLELFSLGELLGFGIEYGEPQPAPREVLCLHLRLARLSRGVCDIHGAMAGSMCQPDREPMMSVQNTIETLSDTCPEVSGKSLSELKFSPATPETVARRLVESASH